MEATTNQAWQRSVSGLISRLCTDGHNAQLLGDPWSRAAHCMVQGWRIRMSRPPAKGDSPMREIVVTEYAEFDPQVSPDGRWLAYTSNRTGRPEVWVQGYPDGAAPVRVSNNLGFEPRWAPNGTRLVKAA